MAFVDQPEPFFMEMLFPCDESEQSNSVVELGLQASRNNQSRKFFMGNKGRFVGMNRNSYEKN